MIYVRKVRDNNNFNEALRQSDSFERKKKKKTTTTKKNKKKKTFGLRFILDEPAFFFSVSKFYICTNGGYFEFHNFSIKGEHKWVQNPMISFSMMRPKTFLDGRVITSYIKNIESHNNLDFRLGPTQTSLYSHRSKLEA